MSHNLFQTSALVQLNISIWSARAKINKEDLNVPEDSLPPEALATLGSKRLFPQEDMRIFGTIKTRAYKYMCQVGVPFMKGWLVDESKMKKIDASLDTMRKEFDVACKNFIKDYDIRANEWILQYPEWESMLRYALPGASQVSKKFCFGWNSFAFSPTQGMGSEQMESELSEVPEKAKLGVVNDLIEIFNGPFNPNKTITKKTLGTLKSYIDKLEMLAFTNSEMSRYSSLLREVYDEMNMLSNPDDIILRNKLKDRVVTIIGEKVSKDYLHLNNEVVEDNSIVISQINKGEEKTSEDTTEETIVEIKEETNPLFDSLGLF